MRLPRRSSSILLLAVIAAGCSEAPMSSPTLGDSPDATIGPRGAEDAGRPVDRPADGPVSSGGDLSRAPEGFALGNALAVPVDFESVELALHFDVQQGLAVAHARVTFMTGRAGMPIVDLIPEPQAASLDGTALQPGEYAASETPDGETTLRVVQHGLAAGTRHTLEVDYALPSAAIAFEDGNVTAKLGLDDSEERMFFEQFAPANLELDRYRQTIDVTIVGGTDTPRLFANGEVTSTESGLRVVYPDHFTTSSFLFYLYPSSGVVSRDASYRSVSGREVPIVVFATPDAQDDLERIATQAQGFLAELEADYGAYPHSGVVIGFDDEFEGGGMEYTGGTITDEESLGHELLHQWFARSVQPADGSAGFIDEAIAQWRDDGYPRAATDPSQSAREPVQLAGFSPYRRATDQDSYDEGAALLSELDYAMADAGGLRPVLRTFYETYRQSTITVPEIEAFFVQQCPGVDVGAAFARYVFGGD